MKEESDDLVTISELKIELSNHKQAVMADVGKLIDASEDRMKLALGSHGLRIEDMERSLDKLKATAEANVDSVNKLLVLVRGDRDYGVVGLVEEQRLTSAFISELKAKEQAAKGAVWVVRAIIGIVAAMGLTAVIKILGLFKP